MKSSWVVLASQKGVTEVKLAGVKNSSRPRDSAASRRWTRSAEKSLRRYLTGRSRAFLVPCDLSSLPRFTRSVLKITQRIPYGEVRTYLWVARQLGKPRATRAVGNALARNPIPIIIPCHRVVRSDGSLGGYALGLRRKREFLALERKKKESRV